MSRADEVTFTHRGKSVATTGKALHRFATMPHEELTQSIGGTMEATPFQATVTGYKLAERKHDDKTISVIEVKLEMRWTEAMHRHLGGLYGEVVAGTIDSKQTHL